MLIFVFPEYDLEMSKAAPGENVDKNFLVGADFFLASQVQSLDVGSHFDIVDHDALISVCLQKSQQHLLEVGRRVVVDVVLKILVKH
jgi:hypothetical protein